MGNRSNIKSIGNQVTGQNLGDGVLTSFYCGDGNIVMGSYSSNQLGCGGCNTVIGYNAGWSSTSGSSNIFIGESAGGYEIGSNRLHIGSTPLIYGELDNSRLCINGTLEVDDGAGTNYLYLGDKDTDGSWRFAVCGTDLYFERRVSGTWTCIASVNQI